MNHFPTDQYLHDRVTPVTLSPKLIGYDKPIDSAEMPCISTCTEMTTKDTNVPNQNDKYPWLDPDDKQRHMTDAEIPQMKLNLANCALDDKGEEEFLAKTDNFHNVFSLRDEIGTCSFIEVHLKLKDETPFFVRPYPMCEEQIKSHTERNGWTQIFRYYLKRTDWLQLTGCLSQMEKPKLYRVCSDFQILNEKLLKINHAFPLVRDCIEQLDRKHHYLSTIDLRDAFHTLQLASSSQKYCGIAPYYGSPTYHYLQMGMGGMSMSSQIWQQFVDLVFQDDLIKCKQNFDVIMDDTFIHSTADEHKDDLMDLFKVL